MPLSRRSSVWLKCLNEIRRLYSERRTKPRAASESVASVRDHDFRAAARPCALLIAGFFAGYLPLQRREATLRAEADELKKPCRAWL